MRLTLAVCAAVMGCLAQERAAKVVDGTHESRALGETRQYRIYLPPGYDVGVQRYPVIYWFHGWSQRFDTPEDKKYGKDTIADYVAQREVIVVRWDGYNPRTKDEKYVRPYNISPVETSRQFALYFPELVDHIDTYYRTVADRYHRAVSGYSMGGFMSYWIAGKFPHLVGSASAFMPSTEFYVGPKGFDTEYRHEEMWGNYDGVRTRMVTGTADFIQFYHRRLNAIWKYARTNHETEEYESEHGTPGIGRTFDFHMRSFVNPLPRPEVWSHTDVYENFSVWDWEINSSRRAPGFTVLKDVSKTGFKSSVREWLYGGRLMPQVKLSVQTARQYPPGRPYALTIVRVRDGMTRRETAKSNDQGRIAVELDGDAYMVGIGPAAAPAVSGYALTGMPWATAGKPVKATVRIWNAGAGNAAADVYRWSSPNPGVQFETQEANVPALLSGKYVDVPLAFTVTDAAREVVRIDAASKSARLRLVIPLYPEAEAAQDFRIADGKEYPVFQKATTKTPMALGEGNGDGQLTPGESFAVLLPDGDGYRAAELFTNDRCVDLASRESDDWGSYDHVGATAKYSLPSVRDGCPAGHVIPLLARVMLPNKPNHTLRWAAISVTIGSAAAGAKK